MWHNEEDVEIMQWEEWFVQIQISENGKSKWSGVFVYASCDDNVRKSQLARLKRIREEVVGSWGSLHSFACPILVDTEASLEMVKRCFVFYSRWIGKEGCEDVIRDAWAKNVNGSRWYKIVERLKNVRMTLIDWCKRHNFNSRVRIEVIQDKLQAAYESEYSERERVLSLEKEVDEAWAEKEKYWCQKAKFKHLKEGDKNTKFFHALAMVRRRRNRMRGFNDSA
ncbi:hypothetical protein LIER_40953 [Lithospermum erythrorhizon]|uniref:Uncharacterized protein n=1 Tax=Lithospermum erythrorhizon TaxID=34254 RepID=A0AAV3R482_LITER